MRDHIQEALKHSRADYTEIRIEEKETTRVVFRGKELEVANANIDKGGIVRCLIKDKGWGVATFNDLDDLLNKVDQATECARVGSVPEPIELAPVEPVQQVMTADLKRDFRDISLAEKKALAERYNQSLLGASDKIVDTSAVYSDAFTKVILANSEGTYIEQDRPSVVVGATAIARDGDNVQQAHDSFSTTQGYEFVLDKDDMVRMVASHAVELLSAKPVKAGQYTVVADQMLAGVFIHEAFGHLSEADFVYENPKAREMMRLGRRFGKGILNAFDDGSIPHQRGTTLFDDEGTPAQRNWLIRDGELVGRLHSRQTAARMGESASGNARAINYRFAPIVRMTNTGIENGATSFEDMIRDIPLGIYACEAYGGQTQLENFSFSSGYAYMIRDGKLAEMVKDVILAGNLFTTLENIDAIGNDFKWLNTGGGCGKGNQYPLPVGMGAPHIRIQNVVIGGE
ncbi:MAG TPA: TldD/PmbA family protein [Anaerolineales bacterium]|nr:TldD/PmbA family protein [Anaerolineales bacterium]